MGGASGAGGAALGGHGGLGGGNAGGMGGATSPSIVTLTFTGHVYAVYAEGSAVIPGIPAVGDPVTGRLAYDVNLADRQPSDPTIGDYQVTADGTGLFVQSGGWSFVPQTTTVRVLNDAYSSGEGPFDVFYAVSDDEKNLTLTQTDPSYIEFILRNATGTAVTSDKLPTTFHFTDWTQDPFGALDFKLLGDPPYEVEAIIDSMTLQ